MIPVRVDIAPDASLVDVLTGDTVDWLDVSCRVRRDLTMRRGRTGQSEVAGAGALSFTLDNADGVFTPGRGDLLAAWIDGERSGRVWPAIPEPSADVSWRGGSEAVFASDWEAWRWDAILGRGGLSVAVSRSGDTYTLWRELADALWWRVTLFRFIDPTDGDVHALNASALVRVGEDVDQTDASWSYAPGEAWIESSNPGALGGTYHRATNIYGAAEWETPADTIAVGIRGFFAKNSGYGRVTIDGGGVVADRLPTAQDEVDAGRLASSALTANGGTLDPSDRLYDFNLASSPNGTAFAYRLLADGMAPGVHEVKVEWTGYARTGADGVRVTIDAGWYQTPTSQPSATASWLPIHTFNTTASSVYEYAFSVKPRGAGTYRFVGNSHGYETESSFTLKVDGVATTMADGDAVVGASVIEVTRVADMSHPDAAGDVAETTQTWTMSAQSGLDLATRIEWSADMDVAAAYPAMLPSAVDYCTTGQVAGEAVVDLTADDGSEHDGLGSAAAMFTADGKAAVAMIVTDLPTTVNRWATTTTRHLWIQDRNGGDFNKIYLTGNQTPGTPIDAGDVWTSSWRMVAHTLPADASLRDMPVRVTYGLPAGSTQALWRGVVTAVRVAWRGGVLGEAVVTAADAVSHLNRITMQQLPVQTVLMHDPVACYPLDETEGTAAQSVTVEGPPLLLDTVGSGFAPSGFAWGEGSSPGSTPHLKEKGAATWTQSGATYGHRLEAYDAVGRLPRILPYTPLAPGASGTLHAMLLPGEPGRDMTAVSLESDDGLRIEMGVTSTTEPFVRVGSSLVTGPQMTPGVWHHVAATLVYDLLGTDVELFVDGVSVETDTVSDGGCNVGARRWRVGASSAPWVPQCWAGRIANVAAHDTALPDDVIADIAGGVDGWTGDDTLTRAARVARAALRAPDLPDPYGTGMSTMCPSHTAGKTAGAVLGEIAQTERSGWWTTKQGLLRLGTRSARWGAPVSLTLDATTVDAGLSFEADNDARVTEVAVSRPGWSHVARRAAAAAGGLVYQSETTIWVDSDPQLEAYADWAIAGPQSEPGPRSESITVDVERMAAVIDEGTVLAVDVDDVIEIVGLPVNAPSPTLRLLVVGVSDAVGVSGWQRTFNVTPAEHYVGYWRLGLSALGSETRLAP